MNIKEWWIYCDSGNLQSPSGLQSTSSKPLYLFLVSDCKSPAHPVSFPRPSSRIPSPLSFLFAFPTPLGLTLWPWPLLLDVWCSFFPLCASPYPRAWRFSCCAICHVFRKYGTCVVTRKPPGYFLLPPSQEIRISVTVCCNKVVGAYFPILFRPCDSCTVSLILVSISQHGSSLSCMIRSPFSTCFTF